MAALLHGVQGLPWTWNEVEYRGTIASAAITREHEGADVVAAAVEQVVAKDEHVAIELLLLHSSEGGPGAAASAAPYLGAFPKLDSLLEQENI